MLHNFIAAVVALVLSASGVVAHDAEALASSFGNLQLPTVATSIAPDSSAYQSQTAAAAASATSIIAAALAATSSNSNSSEDQNSTTQQLPNLSSQPYSSPGATSAVASPNEATNNSSLKTLSSRLNSLITIVGNLATLIPVSTTPQQQPAASAGWTIGDGNNLSPYAAASAISALANTTITTPNVSNPTITGGSISGATVSGYLPTSGGSLTGDLSGTDLTLSGNLTVAGAQSLSGAIAVPYISATSTTVASSFHNASSTLFSVFNGAYFGATATSSFNSAGILTLASPLAVSSGGTGWAAIQSGAVPYGNGSSALSTTTAGTAGQILALLNGVPTWASTTTLSTISGTLSVSSGGTASSTAGGAVQDLIGLPVLNIKAAPYNAVCDGTTDDSVALQSALNDLLGSGGRYGSGGTIVIPVGTCRINSAISIPTTGSAPPKMRGPLRITGAGSAWDGTLVDTSPLGGSTLDLRYSGSDNAYAAKIDTRGIGVLEIDHLNIVDNGSDNFQFGFTTNTTAISHDNHWDGNPALSGTSVLQDAWQFGGTSTTLGNAATSTGFQGFETRFTNDRFSHIRRVGTFNSAANGIVFDDDIVDYTSGSAESNGAAYMFEGVGHGNTADVILGGTVEVTNYPYCASFFNNGATNGKNSINGFYCGDKSGTTQGAFYFDSAEPPNSIQPAYVDEGLTVLNGAGAGRQNLISAFGSTRNVLYHGIDVDASSDYSIFRSRVAINTTGTLPTYLLDVGGSARVGTSTGQTVFYLNGGNTNASDGPAIYFQGAGTSFGSIGALTNIIGGTSGFTTMTYDAPTHFFRTGNVGIGTSTPQYPLEIGAGTGSKFVRINGGNGSGNGGALIIGANSSNGAAFGNYSALIGGTFSSDATIQTPSGGNMRFLTGNGEDARFTSSGNFGIGTTSPAQKLSVVGGTYLAGLLYASSTVQFSNFGAGTLQTDANGNLSVSSDERLKNIQGNFTDGLAQIEQLTPILYKWKPETGYDTSTTYAGFSAQNVQAAIPEAVGQDKNGYLTLQDRPIEAALVNAIKEIATISDTFKENLIAWLASADNGIQDLFAHNIYATNVTAQTGTFQTVSASSTNSDTGTFHTLCVTRSDGTSVCVTGDQLAALLNQAGAAATPESVSSSGGADVTNSENPPHANQPSASGDNATSSSPSTDATSSSPEAGEGTPTPSSEATDTIPLIDDAPSIVPDDTAATTTLPVAATTAAD